MKLCTCKEPAQWQAKIGFQRIYFCHEHKDEWLQMKKASLEKLRCIKPEDIQEAPFDFAAWVQSTIKGGEEAIDNCIQPL